MTLVIYDTIVSLYKYSTSLSLHLLEIAWFIQAS